MYICTRFLFERNKIFEQNETRIDQFSLRPIRTTSLFTGIRGRTRKESEANLRGRSGQLQRAHQRRTTSLALASHTCQGCHRREPLELRFWSACRSSTCMPIPSLVCLNSIKLRESIYIYNKPRMDGSWGCLHPSSRGSRDHDRKSPQTPNERVRRLESAPILSRTTHCILLAAEWSGMPQIYFCCPPGEISGFFVLPPGDSN